MGAALDVLQTCDCHAAHEDDFQAKAPKGYGVSPGWADDALVGCSALEEATKQAISAAKRCGPQISDEVLLNHELLQHARQGNLAGVAKALDEGAWTETRRPLVMKPQKADNSTADDDDPFKRDGQGDIGMTALMFSAQAGSADCVRRLLWASAEVNAVEEDGWTALHFAAKEGHYEVCQALLRAKADVGALNCEDKTPLQVAREEDTDFGDRLGALISVGI
mmetsp:Transcript_63994/g.134576  ORF Transcript_63994/g.134576 Transcript_63994/m.134576 type:complete len:222 (-) Transcript_63994:57-722(-)